MDSKHYVQVLIDGKIYTIGGTEDESYLQKTATYVNEKNNSLRKLPGFSKQNGDYQNIMMQLNIADDYFKALERSREAEIQRDEMEREMYSLKHELVSTQMKLEGVLKDLEERQRELGQLKKDVKKQEKAAKEVAQPPQERIPEKRDEEDAEELARKALRAAMAAARKEGR